MQFSSMAYSHFLSASADAALDAKNPCAMVVRGEQFISNAFRDIPAHRFPKSKFKPIHSQSPVIENTNKGERREQQKAMSDAGNDINRARDVFFMAWNPGNPVFGEVRFETQFSLNLTKLTNKPQNPTKE